MNLQLKLKQIFSISLFFCILLSCGRIVDKEQKHEAEEGAPRNNGNDRDPISDGAGAQVNNIEKEEQERLERERKERERGEEDRRIKEEKEKTKFFEEMSLHYPVYFERRNIDFNNPMHYKLCKIFYKMSCKNSGEVDYEHLSNYLCEFFADNVKISNKEILPDADLTKISTYKAVLGDEINMDASYCIFVRGDDIYMTAPNEDSGELESRKFTYDDVEEQMNFAKFVIPLD